MKYSLFEKRIEKKFVSNNEDEKVKYKKVFFPKMEEIDTGIGSGISNSHFLRYLEWWGSSKAAIRARDVETLHGSQSLSQYKKHVALVADVTQL